ncbi:Uncharacterized protein BP5553_01216 [Venustampulla echinocandica]|uniref:Uncharacterized protein n=1 Tax=Venustampulla echinocandica TaxID=2656787 RepID=A0A370U0E3_9HELO|nr:Uncharacterized protein BP5553_01216 [Venustampulla echinocandica]RDL41237.1 Uncharacterized protein BP5553_01216 [Venustampulla echinocandica]
MPDTSPPPTARRFSPTPVETSIKKVRRFAPEPEETTTRSNRGQDGHAIERLKPAADKNGLPPKPRFAPEPVETCFKSSKAPNSKPLSTAEPTPNPIPEDTPASETPKPRRRFAPQLIETSKRSKKACDTRPATLPTDKTDLTPGVPNIYTRPKRKTPRPPLPIPPENTPTSSFILPHAPRRQPSMRPHPNTRRGTRQDSFQPELEAIPSEESNRSSEDEEDEEYNWSLKDSTPSLTGSLGSSEDSLMRLQWARTRESCDERFSGYLLALAAKAAEKQLKEQALAAFPNETFHETVEHFYDREIDGNSDEDVVEGIGLLGDDPTLPNLQRKSTDGGWAVEEMQQHQEKLNRLREDETNQKIADEATKPTFNDPFWTNGMTIKAALASDTPVSVKNEPELERMRSAAAPPMLGTDLTFRMCPSPKQTKLESDQRPDVHLHRCEDGGGLWGGYCIAEEPGELLRPSCRGPPGIRTPHPEREDPVPSALTNATTNGDHDSCGTMLSCVGDRLVAEEAVLEEFNDTFVTQVYNYLSLGYPALARQYDEELARVSHMEVESLRAEDHKRNAKGHIGLVDAPGVNSSKSGDQPKCPRWKALRVYVLEWGRQHPSMSNGAMDHSTWGVLARRGSWAI